MKKWRAIIVVMLLVSMFVPMVGYATENSEVVTNTEVVEASEGNKSSSGFAISQPNIDMDKVDQVVNDATNTVNNVALKIVGIVSDVSLPICLLLILWGSVLYFIMGVRNLYKKRQGMLIMWGSATFLVIAKFVHLIVFLISLRS